MSAAVPESTLSTAQLLRLANFRRDDADAIDTALVESAPGGGVGGEAPAFQYTVVGNEPNLAKLVIPLPEARDNASYVVTVSQQTFAYLLSPAVPASGKTTTQFVLWLSSNATAGDVFSFSVADPT